MLCLVERCGRLDLKNNRGWLPLTMAEEVFLGTNVKSSRQHLGVDSSIDEGWPGRVPAGAVKVAPFHRPDAATSTLTRVVLVNSPSLADNSSS